MASLFCRNNGVYYVVFSKGGKRVWLSLRTKDINEARTAFQDVKSGLKRESDYRLSYFLERFVESVRLHLAEGTISIHRNSICNFIRLCGDRRIRTITPEQVEHYKIQRVKEVKHVTVNIELRSLRAAFNYAKRIKLIEENPFDMIKLLRNPDDGEASHLSEGEIHTLLGGIEDPGFRDLVQFVIHTMVRRGELIHLTWEDVNLERREIVIRNKKHFHVKGGKPRWIPMSEWVYKFLLDKQKRSNYIFCNQFGAPLTGGTISHEFKKYVRKTNLNPKIHFHSLRHTGISLLINRGVPIEFAQKIAGHVSLRTTHIYAHIEDGSLRSAVSAFPNFN